MNDVVTIAALKREREVNHLRDCYYLSRNGKMVDRPLSLTSVELSLQADPKSTYTVIHADQVNAPMQKWRKLTLRSGIRLPSKGNTSFYVANKKSSHEPSEKTTQEASLCMLEQRVEACEEHQSAMIDSIQRLQSAIDTLSRQDESGVLSSEIHAARSHLNELHTALWRDRQELEELGSDVRGVA
ncbi:MAG: hypothetical protein AAFX93_12905 [Verrucomicrobiota bacterium]